MEANDAYVEWLIGWTDNTVPLESCHVPLVHYSSLLSSQGLCCLRAFTHVVPSAWHIFPITLHKPVSFSSERPSLVTVCKRDCPCHSLSRGPVYFSHHYLISSSVSAMFFSERQYSKARRGSRIRLLLTSSVSGSIAYSLYASVFSSVKW